MRQHLLIASGDAQKYRDMLASGARVEEDFRAARQRQNELQARCDELEVALHAANRRVDDLEKQNLDLQAALDLAEQERDNAVLKYTNLLSEVEVSEDLFTPARGPTPIPCAEAHFHEAGPSRRPATPFAASRFASKPPTPTYKHDPELEQMKEALKEQGKVIQELCTALAAHTISRGPPPPPPPSSPPSSPRGPPPSTPRPPVATPRAPHHAPSSRSHHHSAHAPAMPAPPAPRAPLTSQVKMPTFDGESNVEGYLRRLVRYFNIHQITGAWKTEYLAGGLTGIAATWLEGLGDEWVDWEYEQLRDELVKHFRGE